MLGGEVELQASQDVTGLLGWEGLVERSCSVGVEVVLHDTDALDIRVALLDQITRHFSVVPLGAALGHCDVTPAGERFDQHEEVGDAAALVLQLRQGLWHAYAVALTTLPLAIAALAGLALLLGLALWPALSALRPPVRR